MAAGVEKILGRIVEYQDYDRLIEYINKIEKIAKK